MKNFFGLLLTALISTTAFSQDNMAFKAKIENKNGEVLYIKDNTKTIQEIKLDAKGLFQATFAITEGMYQLFDGKEYAELYLKNGDDLTMTMDAAAFDETIKFEGKGAAENNYLSDETRTESKFDFNALLAMDETNFKKAVDDKKNADVARLEKNKLDPKFVELYKNNINMSLAGLQQYYNQILANKKMNNQKAPNFDYENAAGGKTSLESLKGKYVYVDVWATWCGPCRAEIPFLKEMEKNFHNKNIAFISISTDVEKDHDKWKTFVKEKELSGIQVIADKTNIDFLKSFDINTIPRFILIDPAGNVIDADAARPSNPKLKTQLEGLLK